MENRTRPTGFQKIYDLLAAKKSDSGSVYVLLASNRLIELTITANTVISMRSRGMGAADAVALLEADNIAKINLEPSDVGIERAEPGIVSMTFPLTSGYALRHESSAPAALVGMLRLMSKLGAASGDAESLNAFSVMHSELQRAFPELALTKGAIQQRIIDFERATGMTLPGINRENMPEDERILPEWVLSRVASNDSLMESYIIFYLFWGMYIRPINKMIIKKSDLRETVKGTAAVLPVKGIVPGERGVVSIYRGVNLIGRLNLKTIAPQRGFLTEARVATSFEQQGLQGALELLIAQQDIGSLGLRDGDKVHTILH